MNSIQKPAFIQIKCSTTDCVKEMYTVKNPEEQEAFFFFFNASNKPVQTDSNITPSLFMHNQQVS